MQSELSDKQSDSDLSPLMCCAPHVAMRLVDWLRVTSDASRAVSRVAK